jgi:serine/threonine protein phosphatase 1
MDRPNTLCVMGNHEWKHVQGHDGESHRIVRWQCGPELYERAVAWMRGLPLFLELQNLIVIHWGLEPGVALADQDPAVLLGLPAGEQRLKDKLAGKPWFDAYDGSRLVVFGHHSWAAGIRRGLTFGIDTGCVYGQKLTGLLLPGLKPVSVPARENHWAQLRREWAERLHADR